MQTSHSNTVSVTPGFLIQLATAILLLPINWVAAWLFAAVFHESCHYIVLRLYNVRVFSMRIGFSGAIIETEPMQPKQELLTALAGPFGGLVLLLLIRIFPRIAICALLQSLFNLLPIYPFDGGRALRASISWLRAKTLSEKPLANKQK